MNNFIKITLCLLTLHGIAHAAGAGAPQAPDAQNKIGASPAIKTYAKKEEPEIVIEPIVKQPQAQQPVYGGFGCGGAGFYDYNNETGGAI